MKLKAIIAVIIVAVFVVGFYLLLSGSGKPASFTVNGEALEIKGLFGTTVPIAEISSLELTDSMPAIVYKNNGSGLGSVNKGEFTLEGEVQARLYMDKSKPPFIHFTQGGTAFYLNSETEQKTRELFDQLSSAMK
jgi:hypothetical protein